MNLATESFAVMLGVAAALVFALLLGTAQFLAPRLPRRRAFLATIANNPAERHWRHQHHLGRQRLLLLLPLLIFIVATPLLMIAEPAAPELLHRPWIQVVILVGCTLIALAVMLQTVMLTVARQRQRLLIDASLAIAQALNRISSNSNRTFHDVPTTAGTLDHVIAGVQGIFAVSVVARQPVRNSTNEILLKGDTLIFGDGQPPFALGELNKRVMYFARDCSKLLQQEIHVRHVIAVPGWDVTAQTSDALLIANERNVAMLTGWKDERDFLMDDDVDNLHRHLDERCSRAI